MGKLFSSVACVLTKRNLKILKNRYRISGPPWVDLPRGRVVVQYVPTRPFFSGFASRNFIFHFQIEILNVIFFENQKFHFESEKKTAEKSKKIKLKVKNFENKKFNFKSEQIQ